MAAAAEEASPCICHKSTCLQCISQVDTDFNKNDCRQYFGKSCGSYNCKACVALGSTVCLNCYEDLPEGLKNYCKTCKDSISRYELMYYIHVSCGNDISGCVCTYRNDTDRELDDIIYHEEDIRQYKSLICQVANPIPTIELVKLRHNEYKTS